MVKTFINIFLKTNIDYLNSKITNNLIKFEVNIVELNININLYIKKLNFIHQNNIY